MIHAAAALNVPVLDLEKKSKLLMDTMGQAYMAKFHFLGMDAGEFANFPSGSNDGTHFQELGALENARMVTEEIARQPNDSILKLLEPLLAPLYKVTVHTNLASGGSVTKTRVYPKGATVTLKVKPASGKTFQYWADSKGKSVATANRYTFVQDNTEQTFTAMFQGGSSAVSHTPGSLPLRLAGRILTGAGGLDLRILDSRGTVVRMAGGEVDVLDLSGLSAGAYWVRSKRSGDAVFPIVLAK